MFDSEQQVLFLAPGSSLCSSYEPICVHLKGSYQTGIALFSTQTASLAQHSHECPTLLLLLLLPPGLWARPDWPLRAAACLRLQLWLWLCYCLLLSVNASPEQKLLLLLELSLFLSCYDTDYRNFSSANIPFHFFETHTLSQNLSETGWFVQSVVLVTLCSLFFFFMLTFDMLGNWLHHPGLVNIQSINSFMTLFFLCPVSFAVKVVLPVSMF